ncbi:MAG: GDP-mannose 4,6-dehydratase, partial [Actinobacteria bacterium]|nr:GDP-mannose 4,6-dehydratase [Actinomycetota bacterium]
MKVLITGGAGFIGSNVANRLIGEKYEVVVV